MLELFIDGGGWMWPVLLLGFLALGLAVLQLALRRRLDLRVATLATAAATLYAGLVGTGTNLVATFGAAGRAGPDATGRLILAGLGLSFHPLSLALGLGAATLLVLGVGATLRRPQRAAEVAE